VDSKKSKSANQMSDQPVDNKEDIPPLEIYKQQYAHFGRMNDLLYKLPTIYSALIGALWYFAFVSMEKDRLISTAVFLFASTICWYSIIITSRFRQAFNLYIDRINEFDGRYAVTLRQQATEPAGPQRRGSLSTVRAVGRTLWAALALSILGAAYSVAPLVILLARALLNCLHSAS
jgi:hypothetical protein